MVLGGHAGQENEEPEEEDILDETATTKKVSVERTAPEENEESYNEEMS